MREEDRLEIEPFRPERTEYSHSEDYQILWMKGGFDTVTIDGETYEARPNLICFITPDRRVSAAVSADEEPQGCILRFSKLYFHELVREDLVIKGAELLSMFGQVPKIILSPKVGDRVQSIAEMIDELSGSQIPNRETGIRSLFKSMLIYCDSRCNIRLNGNDNHTQVRLVTAYKELVAEHFTQMHQVNEYARMLHLSPKYLNQVVKEVLGVTAKSVICEQLIIKARRELKFSSRSVKEIAFELGFSEPFHFSSFFKKECGCSPTQFREE